MPFWIDAREERLAARFELGVPWKLSRAEKTSLTMGWARESKIELRAITDNLRKMREEGLAAGDKDHVWRAYRNTWRYASPRWDIWRDTLDRAIWLPKILGPASLGDAHNLIHHVLAVAARRNPQLQLVSKAIHAQWAAIPIDKPQTPHFTPMDDSIGEALAQAAQLIEQHTQQYVDEPSTMSIEHSYLLRIKHIAHTLHTMITENPEAWDKALKTTRKRLDVELRKEEGVSERAYWLPLSAIAIRKHEFPWLSDLVFPHHS